MKHRGIVCQVGMMLVTAVILISAVFISGCSDEEGKLKPNQPPTVWLSSAPPEGSTERYTIHMFWGGWDPDGEIAYYEYTITDNDGGTFDPADTTGRDKWNKVYGNDSTFMFTADVLADPNNTRLVAEFVRSHTFFIRAVDIEGLSSPQPVYRSFTARTLSPRVNILIPPGGSYTPSYVPPITTFTWMAVDYIDDMSSTIEPDSVSWILEPTAAHNQSYQQTTEYINTLPVDSPEWNEWGGWKWYGAPQDSGRFWTTPNLDFEPYVFAIRAKDEAGAITPVFDLRSNVRRIQVSERSTGPVFTVQNEYLGTITTSICHEPVTIMDLPAGIPIQFCWRASADHYGGVVVGYRYGWDIEDLADPNQWEIDYTPFTNPDAYSPPRTFYYGTHTFSVEVIDNSGYCSRVEVKINIIQFTMENNLLVVDDYIEGTVVGWEDLLASGLTPNDAQHDQFWKDVLINVGGFNPVTDVIEVNTSNSIPLTYLARYKSIIWTVNGEVGNSLSRYVAYRPLGTTTGGGRRTPNVLALFMDAGGHLFINGRRPAKLMLGWGTYHLPVILAHELGGSQLDPPTADTPQTGIESFAYKHMCLETLDVARTTVQSRRGWGLYCSVYEIRTVPSDAQRVHTMRAAEPIDPDFPRLELRRETAALGRWYHEDKQGMLAEVYNPQYFFDVCPYTYGSRSCFQPIYGLECLDESQPVYGEPVAFWTSAYADRISGVDGAVAARSAVFGFPLVYFKPDQVRGAVEAVLFGEWQLPQK